MLGKTTKTLHLPTLKCNGIKYEDIDSKVNLLATNYTQVSSDENYAEGFNKNKQVKIHQTLNLIDQ